MESRCPIMGKNSGSSPLQSSKGGGIMLLFVWYFICKGVASFFEISMISLQDFLEGKWDYNFPVKVNKRSNSN
jgi:hypothetical protein